MMILLFFRYTPVYMLALDILVVHEAQDLEGLQERLCWATLLDN